MQGRGILFAPEITQCQSLYITAYMQNWAQEKGDLDESTGLIFRETNNFKQQQILIFRGCIKNCIYFFKVHATSEVIVTYFQ